MAFGENQQIRRLAPLHWRGLAKDRPFYPSNLLASRANGSLCTPFLCPIMAPMTAAYETQRKQCNVFSSRRHGGLRSKHGPTYRRPLNKQYFSKNR